MDSLKVLVLEGNVDCPVLVEDVGGALPGSVTHVAPHIRAHEPTAAGLSD